MRGPWLTTHCSRASADVSVLVVAVDPSDIGACSDWLFQLGATAIEERDAGERVELITGFPDDDLALAARSILNERWPCRLESTGDEGTWRDEWLKWIEPLQVANFVVHAPWHDPALWADWPSELVEISIDPGRAFGSGHHPTTQLVLAALEAHLRPGASTLDVGCGTGILSIAAAKVGASRVLGIDLDYDIIEVAAMNAGANETERQIEFRVGPIAEVADDFDLAVINIVIGDLLPLLPDVIRRASKVIVSGFFDDQFDRLLEAVDVEIIERTQLDGWGCAVLRDRLL